MADIIRPFNQHHFIILFKTNPMRFISLLIFIHLNIGGFAQKKPLVVNEPLAYTGPFIINGDTKNPKTLDAFKGEYLILDLFSSTCIVCFGAMPKINQLQQDYRGKIRFLLIGKEDGKIASTYGKFEKRLNLKLDVIFDSIFFRRTKIKQVPTYIWIRPDGIVAAVTGPESVNKLNLDNFLKGGNVDPGRLVEKYAFDYLTPFFANGNGGPDSNILRRTILARWNPKVPQYIPDLKYQGINKVYNISAISKSKLYRIAYWGSMLWEPGDSMYAKKYPNPVFLDESNIENRLQRAGDPPLYVYSDSYQGDKVPDIQHALQWELKKYFDEDVEFVKRLMPCWVLKLTPGAEQKLRSKSQIRSYDHSYAGVEVKNGKILDLLSLLSYSSRLDTLFIDETGIDYPIDFKIDALLTIDNDFFNAVRKLGISIELERREMEVMLIRPARNTTMKNRIK